MTGAHLTAFYAIVGAYLVLICGIGLYKYRLSSTMEGFLAAGAIADQDLGAGSTGAKTNQILDQTTTIMESNRDRLKGIVTDSQTLTAILDGRQRVRWKAARELRARQQ